MDDDLDSFERELRELRPTPPSAELHRRLDAELARRPVALGRLWWSAAIGVPLAAAAAFALLLWFGDRPKASPPSVRNGPTRSTTPPAPGVFKPIAAANVLYSATDEGLVTLDNGATARRSRLQYVDTIRWQNPNTHASLTWSIPREEIRIIPVRFQ